MWNGTPILTKDGISNNLKKDEVYVIREIYPPFLFWGCKKLFAILEEIPNYSYSLDVLKEVQPPMDITELIEESIHEPDY